MQKNDLFKEIEQIRNQHLLIQDNIERMQKNPVIQLYLEEQENLKRISTYQQYLEQVEIGEDGTIFENKNSSKPKYYTLSHLFNCILSLKYYGSDQAPNTGISITYSEFLLYLDTVQTLLNRNKKYEGDKKIANPYGLEIYQNPVNIKVLQPKEESIKETLKNNTNHFAIAKMLEDFNVNRAILLKSNSTLNTSFFLVLPRDIKKIDLIKIEKLTEREKEAFFGEEVQKILGVTLAEKKQSESANTQEYLKKYRY